MTAEQPDPLLNETAKTLNSDLPGVLYVFREMTIEAWGDLEGLRILLTPSSAPIIDTDYP